MTTRRTHIYVTRPRPGFVDLAEITTWYSAAASDGKVEANLSDPWLQAKALDEAGLITVGKAIG